MNDTTRQLLGTSHELFERGDIVAARHAVDKALATAEGCGDEEGVRASLVNSAAIAIRERQFSPAQRLLEALIAGTYGPLSLAEIAQCRVNLATIFSEWEDLDRADALLSEAADDFLALDGDAGPGSASVVYHRALVATKRHRIDTARRLCREARRRYEALGRPVDALLAAHLAAVTQARIGDFDALLEEGRVIRDELWALGRRDEWVQCTVGWAAALHSVGRNAEAIEELGSALSHLPDDATLERAQILHNRANAIRLDDPNVAVRDFEAAEQLFARLGSEEDAAVCRAHRGTLARRLGDPTEAAHLIAGALEVFERHGALIHSMNARHNLAIAVSESDRERALGLSLRAVTDAERARYELARSGDRSRWVMTQTASIYGYALHQTLRAGEHETAAALAELWRSHSVPSVEARSPDSDEWVLAEPSLIAVRRTAPAVGAGTDLATIEHAARRAGNERAWWLGFVVARDRFVWHLTRPGQPPVSGARHLDPAVLGALRACVGAVRAHEAEAAHDDHDLERLIRARLAMTPLAADPESAEALRRSLPSEAQALLAADEDIRTAAEWGEGDLMRRLGTWLLADPVRRALATADDAPPLLLIAPDPALARVPWPLLGLAPPGSNDDLRLAEIATTAIAPPVPFACRASVRSRSGDDTLLAVLDPTGDLPRARRPISSATTTLGPGTTAEQFVDALRARPRRLLYKGHIVPGPANHPALTALELSTADGGTAAISAADVFALRSDSGWAAPERVALLGCDSYTGGDNFEWASLATAFLWAGTTDVIVTTWPVLDASQSDDDAEGALLAADVTVTLWERTLNRLDTYRGDPQNPSLQPYRWAGLARIGLRDA